MLFASPLPSRARPVLTALLAATVLSLAACGGGGDGGDGSGGVVPPDNGSGGALPTPSTPSINALAGDWVQKGCVRAGNQSFKKLLRASVTGTATIDYFEGVLTFNSGDCTGAAQQAGLSRLGVVTFARSEANATLAAHWGEFLTVTNTRFGAIWTLRSGPLLCLLGDEIPTIQPTLAAVASSLATIPADNCFSPKTP